MMNKMSQNKWKPGHTKRKFTAKDLPWLKKMVSEVQYNLLSQHAAADKYKMTRHQVRKFLKLYGEQLFDRNDSVDIEAQKETIVAAVIKEGLTTKEASVKYSVPEVLVERWVTGKAIFQTKRVGKFTISETEIDPAVKVDTVRKIQSGQLNHMPFVTNNNVSCSLLLLYI